MARTASTHRLDPGTQAALDHLSKILQRPKNRLINEAVRLYVEQRSKKVEGELEATLSALRAYRRWDSDFEKSIEAFVDAEATLADGDPVEARVIAPEGSVRSEIRQLLHG